MEIFTSGQNELWQTFVTPEKDMAHCSLTDQENRKVFGD